MCYGFARRSRSEHADSPSAHRRRRRVALHGHRPGTMSPCRGLRPFLPMAVMTAALAAGCDGFPPIDPPLTGGIALEERWSQEKEGRRQFDGIALSDDFVFHQAGLVWGHRRVDGAVEWGQLIQQDQPIGMRNLVVAQGRVFGAGAVAVRLDAATGEELWRHPLSASAGLAWTAADEGAFYVGTREHVIYAFEAETGEVRWRVDVGPDWEDGGITRGIAVGGDTVYAAVQRCLTWNCYPSAGYVFAMDRQTGAIHWTFLEGESTNTPGSTYSHWFNAPPKVHEDWLLLNDYRQNTFIALDRMTGEERWRYVAEWEYFGSEGAPTVVGDTVFAAADVHAYALDLHTGEVHWRTRLSGSIYHLAVCGDRILVNDGGLAALERGTGRILQTWYDRDRYGGFSSAMPVDGNEVYVATDRKIFAFRCPG
jgi:outer membrane protein assembly factor BamB